MLLVLMMLSLLKFTNCVREYGLNRLLLYVYILHSIKMGEAINKIYCFVSRILCYLVFVVCYLNLFDQCLSFLCLH